MKITHRYGRTAVRPYLILLTVVIYSVLQTGCEKKGEKNVYNNWLDETFSSMTPDQKIGQLFCLSIDPVRYFIEPGYKRNINLLIRKYKPGAVHLSTVLENWKPETLSEFNANKLLAEIIQMQKLQNINLLTGADFENGAWFWDKNATRFSFPMALGATRSPSMAYRQGKITAIEAKAMGINWIFAPVLNTSDYFDGQLKVRCFGDDIENITDLGQNFLKGCHDIGIASCLKYFPVDRIVSSSQTSSEADYLTPFKVSIEAGAFSVMTSPIKVDADAENLQLIQDKNPIGDLLRNRLGFQGLVVSSLNFSADTYSPEQQMNLVLMCIKTGYNMLILPETLDTEIPLIDLMFTDAEEGKLDMNLIDASVKKVLAMKDKLNLHLFDTTVPIRGIAGIGLDEYHKTAENISDASITLIKNDGSILPFDYENQYIVSICIADEFSIIDAAIYHRKLTEQFKNIKHLNVIGFPENRMKKEVMQRVSEADVVLCTFFIKPHQGESGLSEEVKNLIWRVLRTNKRTSAVSFYSPYLINYFNDFNGFIATYSPTERSMEKANEIVFGKRNPRGKLPASLSEIYPAGLGLQYDHLKE